eukprot:6495293-Lingulodinium_polyedra.AAC.1
MHVHMRAAAREGQAQDQYRREDAGEDAPAPRWRPQRSAHGRSLKFGDPLAVKPDAKLVAHRVSPRGQLGGRPSNNPATPLTDDASC